MNEVHIIVKCEKDCEGESYTNVSGHLSLEKANEVMSKIKPEFWVSYSIESIPLI